MKLHFALPRSLGALAALFILSAPVFAADVDPDAAKAAQKLFASSVKQVESVFKDETKAALDLLTADVKEQNKLLKAGALGPDDSPAKQAEELFDCLNDFMASLSQSMREASDQLVTDAAGIINDPDVNGFADGFVMGDGTGLDVALSRLADNAQKLVDNATKRAASVQKTLLKEHGYRTNLGVYLQAIPNEAPVLDADSVIMKRNWAPALEVFVSGRSLDADDGVIYLAGIYDADQSFSESPIGISLTGPGASPKGGPIDAVLDPEATPQRWSATFYDLQSDGGGDGEEPPPEPVGQLTRGNYIATVAHEGFYWVTCAVGVP